METGITLKKLAFILLSLTSGILLCQDFSNQDNVSGQFTHKLTKISYGDFVQEFEYNNHGLIVKELSYDSNSSKTIKYIYNDHAKVALIEETDCSLSAPCETTETVYEYDLDGYISLARQYTDNTDYTVVTVYRRNSDGNPTIVMSTYSEITTSGDLIESTRRQLFEYDSLKRKIKHTNQYLSQTTSNWITNSTDQYAYTEKTTEVVSSIASSKFKVLRSYNTPNKELLVNSKTYEWLDASDEWGLISAFELELDENDNPIESLQYEWSYKSDKLVPWQKMDFIYDEAGNITRKAVWSFSENEQTWTRHYIDKYSYKKGLYFNQVAGAHWVSRLYGNIMPASRNRSIWNGEWEASSEIQYFYQALSLAKEDISLVYPNPASSIVSFDLSNSNEAQLILYDAQGANVVEQTIQTSRSISIQDLKKGTYYYRIVTEGNVQTGKLIKD
ncbi:Por secretion system C-terminal sorting domain-containing protein [Ekhidna lutea]|uniref:Por secretion system C-terminal sorting domain-containing protein n=1 Tax=Ekhidna lutea TaxID=447679 RepID=A0A239H534_EKHLU|nr:T9SS type A sorting domain-containing protein [Ekhidna lutea]SNS75923.1 Por secretion system C-terminal sorting domain-containing protein [Ekhidna lutea]